MATPLPFSGQLGPMQRRFGAIVLGSEVPVILFGAVGVRGLALATGDPRADLFLWVGVGLAVLAGVAAGMLRKPFGVTLGWLVHLVTAASAVLASMILVVAALFLALWVVALIQGFKMDRLTEAHQRRVSG